MAQVRQPFYGPPIPRRSVAGLCRAVGRSRPSADHVPPDWPLIPAGAGFGIGDSFRLLFISSTKRDASSTNIEVYNEFVKGRAAAGHTDIRAYSSGFRVVGCTEDHDARDNTATTGTGVPIYWLDGPKIADDYADFYDGTWDNESNAHDRDETGTNSIDTASPHYWPYTGCSDNGTEGSDSVGSRALGTSEVLVGRPGHSDPNAGPINGRVIGDSGVLGALYGLSAVFTIATPPPEAEAARAVVIPPLTARFAEVPAGHDGTTPFSLHLAFSEQVRTTAEQLQQTLTATGGTVSSVQPVDDRSDRWQITVTPSGNDAVHISLPPTTACATICSSNDSKVLQQGLATAIPRAPLTAHFAEVPTGHLGVSFTLHLAFSEAVATTATTLEQALMVTGGTITTAQPVDDRSDLWEVTLTPSGNDAVSLSLPPTTACADDNAVCTAEGLMLSAGIAAAIPRTPLTAGFESVPEGHHGISFTLHLAFSEAVATTARALEQALTVTDGTINTVQPMDDRRDLWEIQIHPDAADVSVTLSKTASCDADNAVCTQSGLAQQNDAQASIPFSGYLMPHALDKTSGEDQTRPANTQLAESFVVVASDEDGAALAGVIVTFTVSAGGGMLSANTDADPCTFESAKTSITAITDANGQAATRLTLGSEAGTNTVDITVAGLEPEPFTATAAEPATPNALAKVCGEDQEGTVGELLAQPFVVLVSDEDGAAMAGVAVAFAVTAGGGTMSATIETTNADGYARTWLTLGSELGTNTVTATVEGLEPVTFIATGQASPLASLFDAFMSGKPVALPDSPQLAQNAPNPFNSQTMLTYFLPAAGTVSLEVFSLTGQRVAVLRHGRQQAGFHQHRWDGRDDAGRSVASGLYLYRLVTDDAVLTRKLMLLR